MSVPRCSNDPFEVAQDRVFGSGQVERGDGGEFAGSAGHRGSGEPFGLPGGGRAYMGVGAVGAEHL